MRDMDRDYRTKITDHTDISSFNQAVNNIPLMGYMYRTNWALSYAWRNILNRDSGTRQTQLSMMILLTDSFERGNRDSENSEDVAAKIRQDGIIIAAVGIGEKVDHTLLQNITDTTANVITLPEFDLKTFPSLAKNAEEIAKSGNHIFNLIQFNVLFLYPLKTSENQGLKKQDFKSSSLLEMVLSSIKSD